MSTPDFVVAIPARYAASRLPGKPLRLLGGEPLVLHVARRALAAGAREVWVATDDDRIAQALHGRGVRVAMTAPDHASGTDRLAECARIAGWADDTLVVNLQGDEPFAPAEGIRQVAQTLRDSAARIATLAAPVVDAETMFDPNAVKVVCAGAGTASQPPRDGKALMGQAVDAPQGMRHSLQGFDGWRDALYFSRAPIPWHRDAFAADQRAPTPGVVFRHIGIYAYRAADLRAFAAMPAGQLELIESLEQLRALEAGWRIAVAVAHAPFPPGVDTPEDLERAERTLQAMQDDAEGGRD